jgi:hypothetical protein
MKIYRTNGKVETKYLGKRKVTLAELQKAVDGYIEPVPGTMRRAYCNEDGRRRGLLFNVNASERFNQVLVGDVVELEEGDRQ